MIYFRGSFYDVKTMDICILQMGNMNCLVKGIMIPTAPVNGHKNISEEMFRIAI